jgi:hypothetical protein
MSSQNQFLMSKSGTEMTLEGVQPHPPTSASRIDFFVKDPKWVSSKLPDFDYMRRLWLNAALTHSRMSEAGLETERRHLSHCNACASALNPLHLAIYPVSTLRVAIFHVLVPARVDPLSELAFLV